MLDLIQTDFIEAMKRSSEAKTTLGSVKLDIVRPDNEGLTGQKITRQGVHAVVYKREYDRVKDELSKLKAAYSDLSERHDRLRVVTTERSHSARVVSTTYTIEESVTSSEALLVYRHFGFPVEHESGKITIDTSFSALLELNMELYDNPIHARLIENWGDNSTED